MVNITNIDPNTLTLQTISPNDVAVIPNTTITSSFSPVNDRIEYFVYDYNNNLLSSNYDLRLYKPVSIDPEGNIINMFISPETDIVTAGYDTGIVKTIYNFVSPQLDSENQKLFISEISPSRTEIRLSSNTNPLFSPDPTITNFVSSSNYQLYNTFRQNVETNAYFDEFYLNFGNNIYVISINSLLEYDSQNNTISLLVKLYEPLPIDIGLTTELYIVTKKAESVAYQIEFVQENIFQDSTIKLNGPNYNIPLKDETGPLTQFKTYEDIVTTTLSGSYFQLINSISSSSPQLSVNYTDYEDFIFFSSAYQRLYNFQQKVINISSSQAQLNTVYNITGSNSSSFAVSSSKLLIEKEIQTTIASFDGYENFLYYTSGAYAWPKINTVAPYVLYSPTSSQAINWYATQSATASLYDSNNQNNLNYVVPAYLRYNTDNTNYMLFVNLIGQFFDEIWLYTKAITSKLDANSNLYEGVSKDLVATVLESLGTKIYDSTYTLENIYSSLIGLSASGSIYPSTGSALITNYVTASVPNTEDIPTIDDFVKLSYKKIYHNLPYLLKKKGTVAGLRTLINIFGIPDTILQINEFGGKNKTENNDWDYWQDKFNYKFTLTGSNSKVIVPWQVNTAWNTPTPNTLQFRFKAPNLNSAVTYPSQSLWTLDNTGNTSIVLEYTGSGYTSGSYSGSIPDTYNEYATLKFIPNYSTNPTVSASIYLPFFNGDWWSVMVNRSGSNFTLFTADNIYNGTDGFIIGYTGSATASATTSSWINSTSSFFPLSGSTLTIGSKTYNRFSGSYQEVRYYNSIIPSGTFYDYTMNPYSIEGVGTDGAYDQLIFRGALGNDLYTASISIHPKVTGSYITQSFTSNSNFTIVSGSFPVNREFILQDQIPSGIRTAVSKKIKNISTILPYSGSNESNLPDNTVLSPFIIIDQDSYNSSSYVEDINYVEVAFSPQNEIDEDINAQIGYINIGDYIGDPRLVSSSAETYPALDALSYEYFQKYTSNYNIWDYVRIISYYDNALFKMVKDYVPVRSSVATGVIIKQHILERNKYPVPQADITSSLAMVGNNTTSSAILLQGNDDVSGGLCYPITASGVYNLYTTGSITNSTGDNPTLFDIYITSSNGISSLFSQNINSGSTVAFSGSYNASIPSGSSLCFVPDSLGDFFINSVTASLLLANTTTTPYQTEDMLITGSPIQMYTITGSTGGTMPNLFGQTSSNFVYNNVVNITQSWTGSTPSLLGPVAFVNDSQIEFYNGALSGSSILTDNGGELNAGNPYKSPSTQLVYYNTSGSFYTTSSFTPLSAIQNPSAGRLNYNTVIGYNGSIYTYYTNIVYLNEIDLFGNNIQTALSNLSAGDYITFNATGSAEDNVGGFFYPYNTILKGLITSVSQISPTVWRLNLTDDLNLRATFYTSSIQLSWINNPTQYISSSIILDPFLNDFAGYDNSVYNPLIDNVVTNRINPNFFDVDFVQSSIVAQNAAVLISASRGTGSSTPSTVPQSNYTALRSANPRYNGSKNTSPDFNVGAGNTLPSVEIDQTYFAYFDWVGGTNYEIINKAGFHIKYLIGDDGTVLTPNLTGSYYYNLIRTFNETQRANVTFQAVSSSGNLSPLQGIKPIIKSGALGQAIIFSQTGSNPGFLTTMSFSSTIANYNYSNTSAIQTGAVSSNTLFTLNLIAAISGSTATTSSLPGDFIKIQTSDPSSQIVPKLNIQFNYSESLNTPAAVILYVESSTDGTFWSPYYAQLYQISSPSSANITLVTPSTTPIQDTYYRAGIYYTLNSTSTPTFTITEGNFFISQTPPYSSVVTSSYWFTGSSSPNILTGSQFNVDMYGISTQTTVSGSGYDAPYQTFDLQIGDQIRFSADENQVYQIIGVNAPSQNINNTLYLTLNRPIVNGTNLNSFLIRRFVPNPSFVLIDALKTDTVGGGAGFLIPEYASQTLLDKFDAIIANLTEKNLI
jgi:hypothetical protein